MLNHPEKEEAKTFEEFNSHVAADQPEVAIKHGVNENEVISSASLLKKLILRDGLYFGSIGYY
ncbi:hypothetical protein OUZ56_008616 [Daphnia magna]|uniref:Uncharacterized protein n=1 Tax=Daphnia magna TaxID=35525 RepID=A0ABR0ADI5_9CRUS|nr:hypothetical protein OUZ56_008616 [Daphnia magna]